MLASASSARRGGEARPAVADHELDLVASVAKVDGKVSRLLGGRWLLGR